MHPKTPTTRLGFFRLLALKWTRRLRTRCSALSRMAQVFSNTKSASSASRVVWKPASAKMLATISLSLKFI